MTPAREAGSPDPSSLIHPPLRFSGIVASAARLFRANLGKLLSVFALIGTVIFMVPALVFFDVGENLAIGIYLFAGVVLPAALLSIGFAVAARVLSRRPEGEDRSLRAAIRPLKLNARHVLVTALLSGMLALTVVVFLGPLGSLVLALFYGPPILMQVVAVEGLGVQPAWTRTRELMQGHWPRILLALLTISLGLGILATTLLSLGGELAADAHRAVQLALFIFLELVIFGFGYSFLAVAGYVAYYDVVSRYEEEGEGSGVAE